MGHSVRLMLWIFLEILEKRLNKRENSLKEVIAEVSMVLA